VTAGDLQQCLDQAFGDLRPPELQDLTRSFGLDPDFEEAVKTETDKARRWQELRPLDNFLGSSIGILLLTPAACHYFLPAFLYAMTSPEGIRRYLAPVLSILWYSDEYGDPVFQGSDRRGEWEQFAALLTDEQKRCIAHCLVEIVKSVNSLEECEVHMELDRMEYMLEKYWKPWL